MTSASASQPREWWPALGHAAWKLLILVYVLSLVRIFLALHNGLLAIAVFAVMIFLVVAQNHHDRRLCERCIANWPLNPEAEVKKRRRWLRGMHALEPAFATRKRVRITMCVIIVVVIGAGFLPDAWWVAFSVVWYSLIIALVAAVQIHKRLQPWCPQCRGGGGGGSFDPDPVTPPSVRADR